VRVARAATGDRDLASVSVDDWLTRLGQSRASRDRFWDLLTLATLNIDPHRAPADLLAVVLRNGFLQSREASAVGLASVGLTELHGEPARRFIEERGGEVRTKANVRTLEIRENRACGVRLADGTPVEARSVISAVPPPQARDLVTATFSALVAYLARSEKLAPSPIVSLHLWLARQPFEESFLGLWGREFHWVFRKSEIDPRSRHVTMVKSAADSFLAKGRMELQSLAERELSPLSKSGALSVERSVVSVEREATWIPPIGDRGARLSAATPLADFFLAGDWTDTGLPATIESAVASGHRAASALLSCGPVR
jgi:uncharacterized protein with NAD-binding domain and iron-sulfur cluster